LLVERKKEIIYMRETRVDAERKRERKEEREKRREMTSNVERNTTTQNTPTGKRERKKREIQRGRAALIAERESEHTKI
jgi:hypothetical protein